MKHYPGLYHDGQTRQALAGRARAAGHVAILMAVKDGAPYLEAQLESLARQTHGDWSLMLADDGSRDASRAIARRFAATMPGRAIRLTEGPRAGATRNFLNLVGQVPAAADYVAFCDQDDVWRPEKLATALARLGALPPDRPALYCGRTQLVDAALGPIGLSRLPRRAPSFAHALAQNLAGGNTMVLNAPALALLRVAAQWPGPVPAHDWLAYQLVMGAGGTVLFDDIPQVLYRQHGRNLVGSNRGLRARTRRLRRMLRGDFRDWNGQNIAVLAALSPLLTPDNRTLLRRFARLRNAALPLRLAGLWRSGLYRQGVLGQAGLWAAAALKRL